MVPAAEGAALEVPDADGLAGLGEVQGDPVGEFGEQEELGERPVADVGDPELGGQQGRLGPGAEEQQGHGRGQGTVLAGGGEDRGRGQQGHCPLGAAVPGPFDDAALGAQGVDEFAGGRGVRPGFVAAGAPEGDGQRAVDLEDEGDVVQGEGLDALRQIAVGDLHHHGPALELPGRGHPLDGVYGVLGGGEGACGVGYAGPAAAQEFAGPGPGEGEGPFDREAGFAGGEPDPAGLLAVGRAAELGDELAADAHRSVAGLLYDHGLDHPGQGALRGAFEVLGEGAADRVQSQGDLLMNCCRLCSTELAPVPAMLRIVFFPVVRTRPFR
ncbi:hypothetical protein WKI68_35980 [Streptomyces sp. MS1.HAVA.3]|uniref:Uncharacterized protein n=1 Tax=Streptomyces caledonius TaxID=3134107 RepID=A0ABU8UBC5_9ACTN